MLTGDGDVDRRFFARLLDDHLVVVDVAGLDLRILNPTAAALWLMLGEACRTEGELAAGVADLFGVVGAEVAGDVAACLADWLEAGWVLDGGGGRLRLAGLSAAPPRPDRVTQAGPGEEPPAMPTEEWRYRLLGTEVAVEAGEAPGSAHTDLLPRLRAALGGIPRATGAPAPGRARLRFLVDGARVWIDTPAGLVWTTDPIDALSHLVLHLFRAGYPDTRLTATVHAAALGRPGRGLLLFPGLSGCGKSTLTGWLVARGWRYAGDDVVALGVTPEGDREEGGPPLVLPLPTALSLKPGSWPVLGPLYPGLADLPVIPYSTKTARFLPLPEAVHVGATATERTPRAIVFPRFDPAATAELAPLSSLEAVLELITGGFTAGDRPDRPYLSSLFDLLDSVPKYRLSFPSLEAAGRCLSTLGG